MSDRLIRLRDVMSRTGLGRSNIYQKIQRGGFPRAARIAGVAAWSETEISAWITEQLARRDAESVPARRHVERHAAKMSGL